ncbi:MAG: hypothetical protein ABIK53_05770 [bacterium]
MIKISSWICGICLVVCIIFVGIMCAIESLPSSKEWGIILIITAGVAIGSFALSYLGGYIIKGNKGAIRLGMLISVLWVVGSFVVFEPYNRSFGNLHWTEFFGIGIIPVISYLGILWVVSGFLPKKKKTENS